MSGESSKKGGKRGNKKKEAAAATDVVSDKIRKYGSIRISNGSSNSQPFGLPREETNAPAETSVTSPEITKYPPRGKAKLLEIGKKKRKGPIPVEFNLKGQPIGENAAKLSSFLGASARELIPITSPPWKDLSNEFKKILWEHITTSFTFDEVHQKQVFRRMMKLWRDNRCIVVKEVMEEASVVGLQRAAAHLKPDNVSSMDEWFAFLKYRSSPEFKKFCEKFKGMRADKTLLHKTSKKSFARIEQELKEESEAPELISRSDVWIRAYEAKKNGSDEAEEDHELVKQVKRYKAEQDPSKRYSLKDDAVAKVLGPDPRGRVRGYGFGAVPSKVDYQNTVASKITNLENEVQQLKDLVQALLTQNSCAHEGKKSQTSQPCRSDASQSKQVPSAQSYEIGKPQSWSKKQPSLGRVELLNWFGTGEEVVAIAQVESKDPSAFVHHTPLGHDCWKVWILDVFEDISLFRPTSEFGTLSKAQGSIIAWPYKYIKF